MALASIDKVAAARVQIKLLRKLKREIPKELEDLAKGQGDDSDPKAARPGEDILVREIRERLEALDTPAPHGAAIEELLDAYVRALVRRDAPHEDVLTTLQREVDLRHQERERARRTG